MSFLPQSCLTLSNMTRPPCSVFFFWWNVLYLFLLSETANSLCCSEKEKNVFKMILNAVISVHNMLAQIQDCRHSFICLLHFRETCLLKFLLYKTNSVPPNILTVSFWTLHESTCSVPPLTLSSSTSSSSSHPPPQLRPHCFALFSWLSVCSVDPAPGCHGNQHVYRRRDGRCSRGNIDRLCSIIYNTDEPTAWQAASTKWKCSCK